MKRFFWIVLFLILGINSNVLSERLDIEFVGTVEDAGEELTVRIDEVMATAAEKICERVKVKGSIEGTRTGDRVHVRGFYDPVDCVVSVEAQDHFVYWLPLGAELEKLGQSLQFTGRILRIFEMRGETFCDISVNEVFMVTFQEEKMCGTVTVKIRPVVGDVEEGLLPGDEVEFSGTYDERSCTGSVGWHDDFLRKKRGVGCSWILVLGGVVGYLTLRKYTLCQ